MEEFGRLAFKGVADELEDPSDYEKCEREEPDSDGPEAMEEESGDRDCERDQDGRNAEGVAEAIDGVLVAGGVLRDPLLVGAVA